MYVCREGCVCECTYVGRGGGCKCTYVGRVEGVSVRM